MDDIYTAPDLSVSITRDEAEHAGRHFTLARNASRDAEPKDAEDRRHYHYGMMCASIAHVWGKDSMWAYHLYQENPYFRDIVQGAVYSILLLEQLEGLFDQ